MARPCKAYIAGAYEHPTRHAVDKSVAQLHAEVARGALADAGLTKDDVDGYFCAGDAPGLGGLSMVEYMGLDVRYTDSTDTGGSAYVVHLGHAAEAIAAGKCSVALITLAGRPRMATSGPLPDYGNDTPDLGFETPFNQNIVNNYAMAAMRHRHEFGTTAEQLAWIKVAASQHAQHNEHAMLRKVVTVEDVVNSPMIADPLHRLDCCVVSDGGGALVVVSPEIAKSLGDPHRDRCVKVLGQGDAIKTTNRGQVELTHTAGIKSGAIAFEEANLTPADIDMVTIYDSFTITVLITLEDLGFCEKGQGGKFVSDGNLISGVGKLPFNTDGGGLCNNHPSNRGSMTKIIEATRQVRCEAHPKVQVPDCTFALAHGSGGLISTRLCSATAILGRDDA